MTINRPALGQKVQVGHTLTLVWQPLGTKGTYTKGDEFEVLGVETRFTSRGPKPEGLFYQVRSHRTGEEFTLPDWSFKYGDPPKTRDPLEEALKVAKKALKVAKLDRNLKRVNSVRRGGRCLQVPFGKPAPGLAEVEAALEAHEAVERVATHKYRIKVRVGQERWRSFDVTTKGAYNSDAFESLDIYPA